MSSAVTISSEPRLVVTTHNNDGLSVFQSDHTVKPFSPFGPSAGSFAMFDTRPSVPVSNQEKPKDFGSVLPRCPPHGINFCVAQYPPRYSVPMHRTLTLDYAVVMSGEIVLELDNGEEKTVRAGECIVQGGVNHAWHNRTDEVCRVAFVMVGAEKVKLENGEVLGETAFKSVARS
jgi:quercetin dioxygenase-like cupin family protein